MTESEMLNRDAMFWREINYYLPNDLAEIELYKPTVIDGLETTIIKCTLLPFEKDAVEVELENGGAFKRNEVIAWPFIPENDQAFYMDLNIPEAERKAKIITIQHAEMKSIVLRDKKGNSVFTKAKVE